MSALADARDDVARLWHHAASLAAYTKGRVRMADRDETTQAMLERLYERFNARDIDAVIASLTHDVDWPNGWEGGYVHGHDEVRDYWTRQWAEIDPTVTPEGFSTEPDGRIDVTVHQVVKSLSGEVVADVTVHHVYRLRDGQVEHMEIRK